MVLAAGRGERMRPLSDSRPKPLIRLRGRALIDMALDHLRTAGVSDAVVNLHHLGDQIEQHLAACETPRISFLPEARLLDTGGGVRQALPLLGERPFYVVNGDVVWLDGRAPALARLAEAWSEARMDALLLLHPTAYALGYEGRGDFMMTPDGLLRRRREREVAPFVFAGPQILHPRLFEGAPDGAFSLNLLYDRAIESQRLWGVRHDGEWFHVGTPDALEATEEALHFLNVLAVHR